MSFAIRVIIMLMFRSVGKISFFSTFANGAWLGISATSSLTGDVSGGGSSSDDDLYMTGPVSLSVIQNQKWRKLVNTKL